MNENLANTNYILDAFGRKHTYLRISLTDRCNLRCVYCMPEHGVDLIPKPNIMSNDELLQIAQTFVEMGVETIRLTGGEPLIRKDLTALIYELSQLKIKIKLTTNGILLDQYFSILKEIGLKDINISLDTLDKSKSIFITKRDYFDKIMNNIKLFTKEDFNIKVNVVLLKGVNDNEILKFIELTKSFPVNIKFIEFMPFKGNHWDWSKGVSKNEILDIISQEYPDFYSLKSHENSTSSNYSIPKFAGSFGIISTITEPFCSSCNRLRLTADGKLKNCLFARKETDLLTPLRQKEDIKQIIQESVKFKKFSRDGLGENTSMEEFEENRTMNAIGG